MASVKEMNKISVIAPLNTELATLSQVANVLKLPADADRQPDLQYLTAIFVSSGQNKNGAVFLGSELIKARGTIDNKAVDVEHDEHTIIGQITGSVFLNRDRTVIDVENVSRLDVAQQDALEMDIGISAIIHKARFPVLASEISDGYWMVSMEAYYRDYDIKVGDLIIPKEEAEERGLDKLVGSVVHLKDGDKEMGFHLVGRVLRDILFAGVGIVKNPANPRSIIMEAASLREYVEEKKQSGEIEVVNLADISSLEGKKGNAIEIGNSKSKEDDREDLKDFVRSVVSEMIPSIISDIKDNKEDAVDLNHKRPSTCVNYKRYVYTYPDPVVDDRSTTDFTQDPLYSPPGPSGVESPGAEVAKEHWCNLFDLECTARPGDATLPECWRNVFARTVREEVDSHEEVLRRRRIKLGIVSLTHLMDDTKKFREDL